MYKQHWYFFSLSPFQIPIILEFASQSCAYRLFLKHVRQKILFLEFSVVWLHGAAMNEEN